MNRSTLLHDAHIFSQHSIESQKFRVIGEIPEALRSRVMNCTLDTVKKISNHFALLLRDNSLFFVLLFLGFRYILLLTELNEITTIALLRFHYREVRQKKTISINE